MWMWRVLMTCHLWQQEASCLIYCMLPHTYLFVLLWSVLPCSSPLLTCIYLSCRINTKVAELLAIIPYSIHKKNVQALCQGMQLITHLFNSCSTFLNCGIAASRASCACLSNICADMVGVICKQSCSLPLLVYVMSRWNETWTRKSELEGEFSYPHSQWLS